MYVENVFLHMRVHCGTSPVTLHSVRSGISMAKQEGARNSKDMESASSADNLGSADGTYSKVLVFKCF